MFHRSWQKTLFCKFTLHTLQIKGSNFILLNPDYYLYGKASQRVQTTASGQGIKQDVMVNSDTIYSLLANIILSSGTVRVQVNDSTTIYKRSEPVTGTGLATIRIENWKANNTTIKERYHGPSYAYTYWLYGEDKIYRQKLKR